MNSAKDFPIMECELFWHCTLKINWDTMMTCPRIVYAIGQLLLSATAAPIFGLPIRELSLIGLLLIAIGTGGIKPCVAAFGGDQFVLPQQEKYLVTFFSVFYFAINSGSLLSTFLTPELRNGIECFGEKTCYSAAFLLPAILMVISIVIFVVGRPSYKIKRPEGNVVLNVGKCISHAIYNKISTKGVKRDHWLDHADDHYDVKLISDIKSSLQVLKLFLPLPIFWALFEQQGSRWTFQATRMDGEISGYLIKPDQMQVINPLLILIFIPIFETCIYPLMAKIRLINTPLKKLTTGGLLAGVAFIVSALLELQLEKTYPILPSDGLAQLRIFNPRNCNITVDLDNQKFIIDSFDMWQDTNIPVIGNKSIDYTVDLSKCGNGIKSGKINVSEKIAMTYVFGDDGTPYSFEDRVNKTNSGNPALRILTNNNLNETTIVKLIEKSIVKHEIVTTSSKLQQVQNSSFVEPNPGIYNVEINGKMMEESIAVKLGGVYTLQIYSSEKDFGSRLITVTQPNSVHILWLIPQYIIITMAEVMFSVTGLEFAFTQAPISMKSLLQAGWLLTTAFGNLIVVIIAEAKIFEKQANEFFLFAGLMFINMSIFAIMALFYKYVEAENEEDSCTDTNNYDEIVLNEHGGHVNSSFKHKNDDLDS
ncbi:hypothetical protein PV325_002972 [Microctonus aethiopoides]|nr:hypothetical protein PV325_002972 [Microctonus aethiopoides]